VREAVSGELLDGGIQGVHHFRSITKMFGEKGGPPGGKTNPQIKAPADLFDRPGPGYCCRVKGLFERWGYWLGDDCRLMVPPTASKTKRSRNEKSADNHDTHGFEFPLLVPMIGHNALPCRNGVALRAHSYKIR
jgi:hypothetical protein